MNYPDFPSYHRLHYPDATPPTDDAPLVAPDTARNGLAEFGVLLMLLCFLWGPVIALVVAELAKAGIVP